MGPWARSPERSLDGHGGINDGRNSRGLRAPRDNEKRTRVSTSIATRQKKWTPNLFPQDDDAHVAEGINKQYDEGGLAPHPRWASRLKILQAKKYSLESAQARGPKEPLGPDASSQATLLMTHEAIYY